MKATGVVRRLDDLGRIVIPKEIRKNLRLKEGDNLEIFIDGEDVILRRFSAVSKISDLAQRLTDSMNIFTKYNIIIMDTNEFIACSGNLKKELINKPISDDLRFIMDKREKLLQNHMKELKIMDDKIIKCSYADNTIYANGEVIGLIMILSEKDILTDLEMKIVDIVSLFLTKYLED
ncbi:MAG: AbrB/MazE/SpoVT family DNA-binding domain-containing protein [Bacilli bacterium]|nr:AbrB/MazE/SpoVT family DNA-binding domain-containing protein [Bacilli bacterium]